MTTLIFQTVREQYSAGRTGPPGATEKINLKTCFSAQARQSVQATASKDCSAFLKWLRSLCNILTWPLKRPFRTSDSRTDSRTKRVLLDSVCQRLYKFCNNKKFVTQKFTRKKKCVYNFFEGKPIFNIFFVSFQPQ